MKLGLMYAGQGSQNPGMGMDFYQESETFRKIFDLLPEAQRELAFHGPAEKLSDTRNTQPVMVAFAAGINALLLPELRKKGIEPAMVAGLSLGEYSALEGAGVFDAETAIRLVSLRWELWRRSLAFCSWFHLPCCQPFRHWRHRISVSGNTCLSFTALMFL